MSGDCGCCEGLGPETPVARENRPGLPAIAYRAGTHATFRASMLAALSSADRPELAPLRTREDTDVSVALIDAWAAVADILTFHQERIANEAFLRTAGERTSLLHLARLIGYELRPGVAASAQLAYRLETGDDAPDEVPIAAGTRVQSVPGPGEAPQLFETVEAILARPEHETLRPRQTVPQGVSTALVVDGLNPGVGAGDHVLLVTPAAVATARVLRVTADAGALTTTLTLDAAPAAAAAPAGTPPWGKPPGAPGRLTGEFVRTQVLEHRWKASELIAVAAAQGWKPSEIADAVRHEQAQRPSAPGVTVLALATQASIFGHNAPEFSSIPAVLRFGEKLEGADGPKTVPAAHESSWEGRTLADEDDGTKHQAYIYLDGLYPQIVPGSHVVLRGSGQPSVRTVVATAELSRSDFLLNSKVTRLTLEPKAGLEKFTLRATSLDAESGTLALTEAPLAAPVAGDEITLDGFFALLEPGRTAILTGERLEPPGVVTSELVRFTAVEIVDGRTVLRLTKPLDGAYVRPSVTINANVVLATHGESKREVLGSGDTTVPFQRFTVAQPPVTFLGAPTPSGGVTTLAVHVDGVRWLETPTLYGHGPQDRVYITRLDAQGGTTIEFGDGQTGARLPTGQENVEASYRQGLGLGGLVRAGQLTLPVTRPLGVRGVTNPLPADGADDPEPDGLARANAPLTVLTLDRVVSLRDYEDFARGFAGIAKALATVISAPGRTWIVLTLAGNLAGALATLAAPGVRVELRAHREVPFALAAQLTVDPDHLADRVRAAVDALLRERFGFAARAFGQPIALSEVIACIHEVDGVLAVDVNVLQRSPAPPGEPALQPRLWPAIPRYGESGAPGAELLVLDPASLALEVLP